MLAVLLKLPPAQGQGEPLSLGRPPHLGKQAQQADLPLSRAQCDRRYPECSRCTKRKELCDYGDDISMCVLPSLPSPPSQARLALSADARRPPQRSPTNMGPPLRGRRPRLAALGPHRPAHPARLVRRAHPLVALPRRRRRLRARDAPLPDAPARAVRPVPLAARAQRLAAPPGACAAARRAGRRGGAGRLRGAAARCGGERVERVCGGSSEEESGRRRRARGRPRRAGSTRSGARGRGRARVRRPVGEVPPGVESRAELERLAARAADHGVVAPDPPHRRCVPSLFLMLDLLPSPSCTR